MEPVTDEVGEVFINPLQIDDVLSNVFKFLDGEELHSARLVNHQWNREACTHIRRLPLSIDLNKKQRVKEFYDLIENGNPVDLPFGDITVRWFNYKTARILRKLGPNLIRLSIQSVAISWEYFSDILSIAKCLEDLTLQSACITFKGEQLPDAFDNKNLMLKLKNLNVTRTVLVRIHDQQYIPSRLILELFKLSPKLVSVDMNVPFQELNLTDAIKSMSLLPRMYLQKLQTYQNLSEEDVKTLHNYGFKFKELDLSNICLNSPRGIPLLETFLAAQSDSLQNLCFRYVLLPADKYPQENQSTFGTVTFPVMKELLRLWISDRAIEDSSTILSFSFIFSISTTFPSLKFMSLMEERYDEFKFSMPAEKVETLRLELQEFKPDFDVQQIELVFVNLQCLHLVLCNADHLKLVFEFVPSLLGLKISFSTFEFMDSVITGFDEDLCHRLQDETNWDENTIEDLMAIKDPQTFSICSLTRLKYLEINYCLNTYDGPMDIKKERGLTDVSGYLAFLQMAPLDTLVIANSSMFSLKCEEKLMDYHKTVDIETVTDCRLYEYF